MDTKLKSSRKAVWCASNIVCVVSVCAAVVLGCMLALLYHLNGSWHESIDALDAEISRLWMFEVIAFFTAIVTLIVSMWMTGERNEKGQIELNWFDRIFTDLQLTAGIVSGCCVFMICMAVIDALVGNPWFADRFEMLTEAQQKEYLDWHQVYASGFEPQWLENFLIISGLILLVSFTLLVLLLIVKKLKARAFWKNTIIGRFAWYIYEAAKASDDVFWKMMIVMVAGSLLSATWFLLIPVLVLIFIFVPKYARKYAAIKEGVREVKSGNLDYKIPVTDHGELDRLAMDINEISAATSIAVQNELKNQRMKTDLISNVSHDLKTPLTSMLTYVDLLKNEGLDSENAPQYLAIIDEKTRRLQKLTEDLFEAAKASSGAIPVEIEKIEMTSIVNQALAELEERLASSNLEIIFTNKTDDVFVMADGQLLWRVIENLLVNVSKYALPGSRVYMDILERGGNMIVLEIKNMSKEQLNISADELMERFKRGDESRNTEGSGLGLSIAKDLTNLMNGSFEISIDGDLFKASVALRRAK